MRSDRLLLQKTSLKTAALPDFLIASVSFANNREIEYFTGKAEISNGKEKSFS